MEMEYDTGSTTTFKITYLGSRDFEKGNGMHYPYIIDGKGSGMVDDVSMKEFHEIIDQIDRTGKSEYYVWCIGGRRSKVYDYRIFNLDKNNLYVRRYFFRIKYSYEAGCELGRIPM